MSFIFDTSKNETPASIAKKRAIAEAIMGNMAPRRANNVGEGIGNAFASIGQGIQSNVLNRRADKAEQVGTASAQEAWNPIASILAGGGAYPPSMASGASPTSGAATGTSNPQQAASIREGLISRGLPQHVADAFVMNFQDESGLNPGINEASPTVAGSRGGYGLYQLTGPRRREYEAFAQSRGASPDSVDAQLDFLMTELQGSESKAAQSILGAPDTATAAQAIVNNFLRPAEQHRSSRSARYANAGGLPQGQFDERFGSAPQSAADAINSIAPQQQQPQPPMPQESMAMAQPEQMPPQSMPSPFTPQALQQHDQMMDGAFAPQGQAPQQMTDASGAFPPAPSMQQQPQQPQQQGTGMVPMDKLMQAASNPFLSEQQRGIVNMLIKQQMDASNPSNQLDMDYKRAQISALQAKASGEGKNTEYGLNPIWGQDEKGNAVLGVLGKDGSFKKVDTGQFDISSGTEQIDLGDSFAIKDKRSGQIVGTVPKNLANAETQKVLGKAQGEAQAAAPSDYQAGQNAIDLLSNIKNDPYRQRGTGVSSMLNAVPGTGGYDFNQKVEQAKSGAFLSAIQQMRGMGSLSNAEGAAATAAVTRMNTSMSEEGFLEALADYEKIVVQGMDRARSKISPTESQPQKAGKRLRFNPQTGELE